MDRSEIKNDLKAVSFQNIKDGTEDKSFFECDGKDGYHYIIALIGASLNKDGRSYAQMQSGMKPKVFKAYERSKKEQKKFFLMVPDKDKFKCCDYYIFIELLIKGSNESSSFEIKIPSGSVTDIVTRVAKKDKRGIIPYFVSYVPAIDNNGNKTTEFLKQYMYSFDSRPFSNYITKFTDFISGSEKASATAAEIKESWPNNFLIAGAPGTGKSYTINEEVILTIRKNIFKQIKGDSVPYDKDECEELIKKLAKEQGLTPDEYFNIVYNERVRRVTFYDEYSYESFVGCYRPVPAQKRDIHTFNMKYQTNDISLCGETSGNQVNYAYEPGPFINTYIDAINNPSTIYFLLIEEINRAKAASVFGDMFQLLDRKEGISEYSITPETSLDDYLRVYLSSYSGTMKLPKNMYIWATMNNADQGVYPLDSAFKRRWGYMYIDVNTSKRDENISIGKGKEIRWNIFREYLNDQILSFATEDKCIGAWYFKDEELKQIRDYFNSSKERLKMINPLSDKLLIYLLNDVCRINPSLLFNEEYSNMPNIRSALASGIGLDKILDINWDEIFSEQEKWIQAQKKKDNVEHPDGDETTQKDDAEHLGGEEVTQEADAEAE